jgi:hypothetical protein
VQTRRDRGARYRVGATFGEHQRCLLRRNEKSRTRAVPAAVTTGDVVARLSASGYDGATYIPSAYISFETEAAVVVGTVPQKILFNTGGNSTPTTKLTILSSGAIYNVQVNTAAEFASIIGIHALGLATPIAGVGDLRMRSQFEMAYRNALNTADIVALLTDASNNLLVGDDSRTPNTQIRATTSVAANLGGTNYFSVGLSKVEILVASELSFARGVANPFIVQQPRIAAGNGQRLWVHAQSVNAAGANGDGGPLVLTGGKSDGTGLKGRVQLGLNLDDTAANIQHMVEVAEITATRRAIALANIAVITTTELPASTGDGIVYLANAQTVPSADAVAGHIYYSDSARPAWRFNGVNLRLDGTSASASAGAGAAVPATVDRFLEIQINGTTQLKIPCFAA